jgi:hypothetical protein
MYVVWTSVNDTSKEGRKKKSRRIVSENREETKSVQAEERVTCKIKRKERGHSLHRFLQDGRNVHLYEREKRKANKTLTKTASAALSVHVAYWFGKRGEEVTPSHQGSSVQSAVATPTFTMRIAVSLSPSLTPHTHC